MLEELHVENLGIIRSARIEPGSGLVAVTGETGAGKTLLLGALRLLRGDTARTDRVGPHADEARAEGRFSAGATEIVVARRVAEGKSRAYLDGSMVPAKTLTERLDSLVEIVAQHEHVALRRESSVRRLVDGLLDSSGREARDQYRTAWDQLSGLQSEREQIGGDVGALTRELELLRHQGEEIESAALTPGEDEELRTRLTRMRNAEEITSALASIENALQEEGGAGDALRTAISELQAATRLDSSLQELETRVRAAIAEVDDIASEVRRSADSLDHDPASLASLEERAALIGDLKRKYAPSVPGIISFGSEATEKAAGLERLVERASSIDAEIEAARETAVAAGEALTEARRRAGKHLAEGAVEHLKQLGFRDPLLSIDVTSAKLGAGGADRIGLKFASDAGLTPGPVSRVASGGELSRLVLAVRVAAGVAEADIVAFDEIDAGVGGSTALAMGELLHRLSRGRQVFVVTHLPQVAAFADSHLVVDRSGKEATVRSVESDERVAEIARMLGGMGESDAGRDHAAELLSLASEKRGGN